MKFSDRFPSIKEEIYKGSINANNKNLTSLDGSPKIIKGSIVCMENNLKSLEGSPETLKGRPEIINGVFNCSNNNLTSLEYCPKMIQRYRDFRGNVNLKNVKQQIIENQIKASFYYTDTDGIFDFYKIEEEFKKYGEYLEKKKNKIKLQKSKIMDYGLSI